MKKLMIAVSVVIIALIVSIAATFILSVQFNGEPTTEGSDPSIDEVLDRSWDTEELTTNVEGDDYVRASFRIQADSGDTVEEVEKRDFQIKNAIIHRLAEMDADELGSSEGLETLEAGLQEDINQLLDEGEVESVYTTSRIIQ
ncbi:flagellar basal body-associated protein FliL [Natribacillus halophilus]|uniref:Flagellar protein FliL n=1 Tax=Natribacillus halophilus TaxID=549003 RepID=A0A1G8PN89_9BACI|nr:flagellar basal body-associated protein FliL [Natribacillus halophilus]SDI94011.1 flagellar FliL protein [Natribacillus halophilus]